MGDEKNIGEANAGFEPYPETRKGVGLAYEKSVAQLGRVSVVDAPHIEPIGEPITEAERAVIDAVREWVEAEAKFKAFIAKQRKAPLFMSEAEEYFRLQGIARDKRDAALEAGMRLLPEPTSPEGCANPNADREGE